MCSLSTREQPFFAIVSNVEALYNNSWALKRVFTMNLGREKTLSFRGAADDQVSRKKRSLTACRVVRAAGGKTQIGPGFFTNIVNIFECKQNRMQLDRSDFHWYVCGMIAHFSSYQCTGLILTGGRVSS
eukprot:g18484.t1